MKGSTSKKYKDPRKHALLFKCKGWELYEATTPYTDTNKSIIILSTLNVLVE